MWYGVWLKIAKKGSGRPSVARAEGIEVALCYGWIDSQRKSHDAKYFLQRYSPRRRGSSWSRVNVERAEALIAAGRMRAPGFAEIEAAKADGRWQARRVRKRDSRCSLVLVDQSAEQIAAMDGDRGRCVLVVVGDAAVWRDELERAVGPVLVVVVRVHAKDSFDVPASQTRP